MRILFLSRWYPYPPDNGSKIRVANLLQALCERHSVTLISFLNPEVDCWARSFQKPIPEEIYLCPYRDYQPHSWRAIRGYWKSTPRFLVDTHSLEMEDLIRQVTSKVRYDLVIASQLTMASYFRCFQGIPAIFEEVELGVYQPRETKANSIWSGLRRKLTWSKHRRFVASLLQNFTLCTVASEVERSLLAAAIPHFRSVYVIPNCIDLDGCHRPAIPRDPVSLIFTGSLRYGPNHDGMRWFLNEIYPVIKARVPEARLTITGDPGSYSLPPGGNVVLTGRIEDVQSVVSTSAVSVAPIRSGGGTRLKILESMALRTPVVATTKAVEGLGAQNGEHLHIADNPVDFAQAVLRLLREPEYAKRIADNAFKLVRTHYDRRIVLPRFMHLVDQAVIS